IGVADAIRSVDLRRGISGSKVALNGMAIAVPIVGHVCRRLSTIPTVPSLHGALVQVVLFHVGQNVEVYRTNTVSSEPWRLAALVPRAVWRVFLRWIETKGWRHPARVGVRTVESRKRHLLQIVLRHHACGGFTHFLNSGQEQA